MAYTRGSVVVLVGKRRRDARCTSVAQFLKTLRVDTLWEREIGMCCCTLVTKLTANCVSQFFVAQVAVLAQRQMSHVCSHMVVAWPPVRVVAYGAGVVVGQLRVDVKPPLYSCCVFFFVSLIVF